MAAAASPRFSPSRAASKGLQACSDNAFRDWKPVTMKRDCTSAPTTMTWSYAPERSIRMPCIKAARPEIQALDTTTGLLVTPNLAAMRVAAAASETSSLSICSTLPLMVESTIPTRGPDGSNPACATALRAASMAMCSKKDGPLKPSRLRSEAIYGSGWAG